MVNFILYIFRFIFLYIYRVEFLFPDFSKYRAIISSSGHVRWEPAGVFETSCKIDISLYPYDRQSCYLEFGTWAFTSFQVRLFTNKQHVFLLS